MEAAKERAPSFKEFFIEESNGVTLISVTSGSNTEYYANRATAVLENDKLSF